MMGAWIATALLASSWLLGLTYYQPANPWAWAGLVASALVILLLPTVFGLLRNALAAGCQAPLAENATAAKGTETVSISVTVKALAAMLLVLPAVWFASWPCRAAPLLLAVGFAVAAVPIVCKRRQAIASGLLTAGVVLLVQAVVLTAYSAAVSRSHDLPDGAAAAIAGLARLLGVEAAADGPTVVLHSLRQVHRLAATWELVLDPVTLGFLAGGLAMLALTAWLQAPPGRRGKTWLAAAGVLVLVVAAWLPLRTALMIALYLHRAVRADYQVELDVMNHFYSSWVHLALLLPPVLLAWRFVRLPSGDTSDSTPADTNPKRQRGRAAATAPDTNPKHQRGQETAVDADVNDASLRRRNACTTIAAAALILAAVGLFTAGVLWDPVGPRKGGRVMFVERHSTWSPTLRPYDTTLYGEPGSYNYAAAYAYLGQFFEMSQLKEEDGPINDAKLAPCDVLVIKIPTARYSPGEVEAVVRFVRGGGGLLLVGDHTNYKNSSTYMNEITRDFGFTFRDDLLFSLTDLPYEEEYRAGWAPHPAVQHVPRFDFAVSCSVAPGLGGRSVIRGGSLWGQPSDYHMDNFHPYAKHCAEMRGGPFVQVLAARPGEGRTLAFTDSTIYSNFCVYQPGKADLLVNMIEWLNHDNPPLDPRWWLLGLGLVPLGIGVWLVVRRGCRTEALPLDWLLLAAAGLCGWAVTAEAVAAAHRAMMPLPEAKRPMTRVVIDRTTSQVPLAKGAYNENKQGQGYGLFEQWIARLNCYTVRATGLDAFFGDALVVICPNKLASPEFRDRLVQYVANGGRLLVLDAPGNENSTANELLAPFGLDIVEGQARQGTLQMAGAWPGIRVDQAWEVLGGRRVASLNGERTICATARHGKGQVMAMGFASFFNDAAMGNDFLHEPKAEEAARFPVLYALVELLLRDKAVEGKR